MVVSMERWLGKTAIVTGASSGIGAAIVKALVENGVNVVGLARRVEKIEEMIQDLPNQKGRLYAIKTDVSIEEDILKAIKWTMENIGPVHILVNNAGIRYRTSLIDCETDLWKKTIDTNLLAVCIATREAIKIMRDHKIDGHIINMNSILGHNIFNTVSIDIYPCTKYAITAYTESLRLELMRSGSKIKVTSISPGAVDTAIFDEKFRQSDVFQNDISKALLRPEDIADATVYALSTPPHLQVHELTIKPIGERF